MAVGCRKGATDFAKPAKQYQAAASADGVSRLADKLGVSSQLLQRLRIGWDGAAWTFSMQDAAASVTGIRRRFPQGRKLSVKGGRDGLFVPDGIGRIGQRMVCEGPTDMAAMLTLGFDAVGRPSCRGCVPLLATLCEGVAVVIVADRDPPGRSGAEHLARRLALVCPSVKLIHPPDGPVSFVGSHPTCEVSACTSRSPATRAKAPSSRLSGVVRHRHNRHTVTQPHCQGRQRRCRVTKR